MKIQMNGGPPWGFRMTGGHDFRQPLAIGKVTSGGKAARAGVAEGHHILTVNGEDVTQLSHLDAQNRIKAAKTTLTLEISNAPVAKPVVPEITVPSYTPPAPSYTKPASQVSHTATRSYISSNKSPSHSKSVSLPPTMSAPRSPTSYSNPHIRAPSVEEKSVTPDIEYRPVDSRDSQRRLYEELQDSEYAPTAHQSTLQSPSMKALARSSAYSQASQDSDPQTMQVTEEIRDMILDDENNQRNGKQQPAISDAALRPTGVKVYNPPQKLYNKPSPAPYSGPTSNDYVQPQPPSPRSPTSSYVNNQPLSSNNSQPSRSMAVGNISKFLQSSGAKQGSPTFLKPLQDLQCPLGDPAVLEIRIGNTLPVPTVAWYHNERPVRESKEKDIKFLSRGIVNTLVLGEFTKELAGRYRCVLTNRHGSTSCSSFLTVEHLGDGDRQHTAPQTYSNNNPSGHGYQPSYSSNYSQPQQRVTNPPVASNSVGLYSQNTAREAYGAMAKKRDSRDSQDEESAVMRALREQGQVGDDKPQQQSRSMKMLEETLLPESDDL